MSDSSNKDDNTDFLGPNAKLKPKSSTSIPKISVEVLERLRLGDHDAFSEVFVAYFDKIKYFTLMLLHSKHDAEELSHGVFVQLWLTHERIDPAKNFNAYIYRMARNAVYNHIRDQTVRNGHVGEEWTVDPIDSDSEEILIAEETKLLIDLVVSRMPPQRKAVFRMSRYENLSNEEIAEKLGISRNAVEKHLRYALGDLKNALMAFFILFNYW